MSTHQDTNLISPDALVLGYQVRDHHLPNRPPLARTDTYAQALRAVEQLHQAYPGPWPRTARAPPGCPKACWCSPSPPPAPSCVTCPLPAARPADEPQGRWLGSRAASLGVRGAVGGGHAEPVPVADGTERS